MQARPLVPHSGDIADCHLDVLVESLEVVYIVVSDAHADSHMGW